MNEERETLISGFSLVPVYSVFSSERVHGGGLRLMNEVALTSSAMISNVLTKFSK